MGFDQNQMMLELFRSEVESHTESLTSSLLLLERTEQEKSFFDSMMRSAHSIKGAARIVGVEQVVELSHVMEDCFVAAQRGQLTIGPDAVDIMLRAVDLITRLSEATKEPHPEPTAATNQQPSLLANDINLIVTRLTSIREGQPVAPLAVAQSHTVSSSTPQHASEQPVAQCIALQAQAVLNSTQAQQLRQQLLSQWHTSLEQVTLDLSAVTDIDAIGLAFLHSLNQYCNLHSVRLNCTHGNHDLQLVMRLAGIDGTSSQP